MLRDVAVIIPTYRSDHALAHSLAILHRAGTATLVVVDNASLTGVAKPWQEPQGYGQAIVILGNEENLGFATAVNRGIRATETTWVALLNDDAIPEPTWLSTLLDVAESSPRIGAVASRMMFRDAPEVVSSAGVRLDASGGAWDLLVGSISWPANPVDVFGASGGACLFRREMLKDVGLLEDSFFAYLEDVDLAWRMQARGWKAVLAPDAVVHHAVSGTAGEGSAFKRFHLARNKWRVILRNYPTCPLLAHLPIILFYDLLSLVHSLVRGDLVPLRGRLAALREWRSLLRQRREIQARTTVPWRQVRAVMSPLESPLTLFRRARLVARLASPRSG